MLRVSLQSVRLLLTVSYRKNGGAGCTSCSPNNFAPPVSEPMSPGTVVSRPAQMVCVKELIKYSRSLVCIHPHTSLAVLLCLTVCLSVCLSAECENLL